MLFGFLWSGEVVAPSDSEYSEARHLSYGDLMVNDVKAPKYVEVRIKASKTDSFWKGVSEFLGEQEQNYVQWQCCSANGEQRVSRRSIFSIC